MLLGDVGSGNASCHSRALSAGSHRRLFSSDARFQCHLSARELQYAGRDKSQPDYRLSNQRHSKINCDCQTDRNCETPGYECARRVARHRSPGRRHRPARGHLDNFADAATFVQTRFERLGYDVRRTRFRVPSGTSWGTQSPAGPHSM